LEATQTIISVACPWCEKSEIFADKNADINVSCRCTWCKKYYKIDFKTLRAIKIRAAPRKSLPNKNEN